jgi:hypothetical protein
MRAAGIFLILFIAPAFLFSQDYRTPAMKKGFSAVTSYEELAAYVHLLDDHSDLLEVEVIGQSVRGRNLYGLKFSSSKFGGSRSKARVMIFAQQHGNEQSGKEGALLLAQELLKSENQYLFNKIDLLLIPQINPDGSEKNERRNANGADLNRNHLILTEPETRAIHKVFDRYLFEVTMDVHEYSPYGEDWKRYGYRKNSEVTVGATTNPNVSGEIRALSIQDYLPFILKYLKDKGFSSFEYLPGGPPGERYIRRSTYDINDGRQGLGIQNTFSFIQEGMNGTDGYIENLARRAEGQYTGMRGLLEYVYRNKDRIKDLVKDERNRLVSGGVPQTLSVQSEHAGNGERLQLPLYSYHTGKDTVVIAEDYRPVVKPVHEVTRPDGYLVPRELEELTAWAERHALERTDFKDRGKYRVEQYFIHEIDSIDFEGDQTVDPQADVRVLEGKVPEGQYIYIPTAQLKGSMLSLALEVKSILGLVTYKPFAHLLKAGEAFPVMRVVRRAR